MFSKDSNANPLLLLIIIIPLFKYAISFLGSILIALSQYSIASLYLLKLFNAAPVKIII